MSVLEISRVDRLERTYNLTALFPDLDLTGASASLALLPVNGKPTAATVWTSATLASGSVTVLLAGPDADSTGALVVPASADLWVKVTAAPEVDAAKLGRINVLGGGAVLAAPTGVPIISVNGQTGAAVTVTAAPSGGAGGALSGTYPNPGLNETTVDSVVAGKVGTSGSATAVALRAAFVPKWTASTAVTAGLIVLAPDGKVIQRNADGTTRASYDATEQALWTVVSGAGAPTVVDNGTYVTMTVA